MQQPNENTELRWIHGIHLLCLRNPKSKAASLSEHCQHLQGCDADVTLVPAMFAVFCVAFLRFAVASAVGEVRPHVRALKFAALVNLALRG